MYPILYDKSTNNRLAELDNIIKESASITRNINNQFTFSFDAHEKEMKSEYFESETYVAVGNKLFDLKYTETEHKVSVTYRIECEHVFYRLIDEAVEYYTFDGTPTQILNNILTGTEFTSGDVQFSDIITFAVYEQTNKMSLIIQLANLLGGEIDFNDFQISIKNEIGMNRGFEIRLGKNLKGITKAFDRRNDKVAYSVNVLALKNSETYKENGLDALEVIEEGDTVRIVDEVLGINLLNRIIKRTYNPMLEKNVTLEIANFIELITDNVTKIKRETVVKGELYNGIRISPEIGFEAILSNNKARSYFNAKNLAMQAKDNEGNWVNKLYYNINTETGLAELIFDGELTTNVLNAIKANIDIVISNTTITQTLSAKTANIAELTVDQIDTSDFVQKYLDQDQGVVNYWKGYKQNIELYEAIIATGETQVTDRDGNNLYWTDNTKIGTTFEETDYPVMRYIYNGPDGVGVVKMKIYHKIDQTTGYSTPEIVMGAGTGVENNGKLVITKSDDAAEINYYSSVNGEIRQIAMRDSGIEITPYELQNISFGESGFEVTYSGNAYEYGWTKDGNGKIIQLTHNGSTIPIVWQ